MLEIDTMPSSNESGLNPRLDGLQAQLVRAIACASPRSTVRDIVVDLVDHLRIRGVSAPSGVAAITEMATRATNAAARQTSTVAPLPVGYPELVSMWASARYSRAD